MKGTCFTGTSGWSYNHWQGDFYPEGLKASERLAYYASHFDSVEVNNTFYRLPSEEAFLQWKASVPANFLFSLKASRYISHMKKLKNCKEATAKFSGMARLLHKQLGPVLFQLPPRWRFNGERIYAFLSSLDPELRFAIEFRDESWFNDEAYGILEKYGVALCLYHMPGFETPIMATAPFVYIRFHGTDYLYGGSYPEEKIRRWGEIINGFTHKGIDCYAYFNNDAEANSVKDALRLKAELEKGGG